MVKAAAHCRMSRTWRPCSMSNPKMNQEILRMVKTPALTTATACSNALAGVGAAMAAGSQR